MHHCFPPKVNCFFFCLFCFVLENVCQDIILSIKEKQITQTHAAFNRFIVKELILT